MDKERGANFETPKKSSLKPSHQRRDNTARTPQKETQPQPGRVAGRTPEKRKLAEESADEEAVGEELAALLEQLKADLRLRHDRLGSKAQRNVELGTRKAALEVEAEQGELKEERLDRLVGVAETKTRILKAQSERMERSLTDSEAQLRRLGGGLESAFGALSVRAERTGKDAARISAEFAGLVEETSICACLDHIPKLKTAIAELQTKNATAADDLIVAKHAVKEKRQELRRAQAERLINPGQKKALLYMVRNYRRTAKKRMMALRLEKLNTNMKTGGCGFLNDSNEDVSKLKH